MSFFPEINPKFISVESIATSVVVPPSKQAKSQSNQEFSLPIELLDGNTSATLKPQRKIQPFLREERFHPPHITGGGAGPLLVWMLGPAGNKG